MQDKSSRQESVWLSFLLRQERALMAAYAALLALARSLQQILDLAQYVDPLHKEKILYLHGIVVFMVTFLENYSDKHRGTVDLVGNGIRKAAYEAQDFMDLYLCSVSTADHDDGSSSEVNLDRDLTMAFERIGFIWEEMMKMKNCDTARDLRSATYSSPVDRSSTIQATAKKIVVGFDDDLIAIKERLYEDADELQIIPIVGMGGIGKTTLARRAYDDSILTQHFDISAWITVSQDYQRGEILSGLFQSLMKSDNYQSNESEAQLATKVYQNLKGRRYLIVVDDIWSFQACDDLKRVFPDDGNRSRILLTTRILDVAAHLGSSGTPVHQMMCLNEDQSWKLLQERVFGQQSCPLQLVEVGKKIAKNCGGLPLTLVVVAGLLLSSGNVTREQVWENVSENISSREPTIALQCSKILCFSYDRLPVRLKPCFLYIAAFPEDSKIGVSKLIKLWAAEGFLKPNDLSKCLEDVGEQYLEDLVNRSLLLVSKKGRDGKLKTVGIHDMLREICINKAEEEGFLHQVSSKIYSRTKFIENPYRRLTIYEKDNFVYVWKIQDSSVRSILYFSMCVPIIHLQSRHVCVLDAPLLSWRNLLDVIATFVNLRYFAFALDDASCPHGLPVSISKHPNLETIVVRGFYIKLDRARVPYEILKTPKLRHLIYNSTFCLSCPSYPSDMGIVHESALQTIETTKDFIFSKEIAETLVNLKKLKVEYYMKNRKWEDFNFDYLLHMRNLEDLRITMLFDSSMTWEHAFPMGLKKLSLRAVPFPWENMTLIGSLPNLQVLRMTAIRHTKSNVSEWRTLEGQFLQLKYFCSSLNNLVKWETEKEHFPCLETLVLYLVMSIDEIPSGIGQIDTLQYIRLRQCIKPLVDSAKQIERLQHENGNDEFRVHVIGD